MIGASLPHDPGRGLESLDALVQVLVKRVSAVRGHDDVVRLGNANHRRPPNVGGGRPVLRIELSGEDGRDPILVVERDVKGERDLGPLGDGPDGIVDRVPLQDAPARQRTGDLRGRMELADRVERGQARGDHLGTAGEAREEMRLHESERDANVRLEEPAVEARRDVRAGHHTKRPVRLAIIGVVLDDLAGNECVSPSNVSNSSVVHAR